MPSDKKMKKKIEKYEKRLNRLHRKMTKSRSSSRSRSRSCLRDPSPCSSLSDVRDVPEYYAEEGSYIVEEDEMEATNPTEPNTAQPAEEDSENIIAALGIEYSDDSKFEGKLQSEITKRFNHILINGLNKEEKAILLKMYKLPENCQLLEAPILNDEVESVMTESSKLRDRSLERVQHQLGLATAIVGHVMTNLIENKAINKIELVTKLNDASKLLNDINFQKTKTRRTLIAPLLDKNFNQLIEKVKRDEHLYGIDLGAKIKTSQDLKKSSSQIKKSVITRPVQNKTVPRYKAVGNRYGPPQNQSSQQPRAAAPRGGPRNRATHPPPRRAGYSHSYSRSRPERAAPREPHSKH